MVAQEDLVFPGLLDWMQKIRQYWAGDSSLMKAMQCWMPAKPWEKNALALQKGHEIR